jgi:hypothetical protein
MVEYGNGISQGAVRSPAGAAAEAAARSTSGARSAAGSRARRTHDPDDAGGWSWRFLVVRGDLGLVVLKRALGSVAARRLPRVDPRRATAQHAIEVGVQTAQAALARRRPTASAQGRWRAWIRREARPAAFRQPDQPGPRWRGLSA